MSINFCCSDTTYKAGPLSPAADLSATYKEANRCTSSVPEKIALENKKEKKRRKTPFGTVTKHSDSLFFLKDCIQYFLMKTVKATDMPMLCLHHSNHSRITTKKISKKDIFLKKLYIFNLEEPFLDF